MASNIRKPIRHKQKAILSGLETYRDPWTGTIVRMFSIAGLGTLMGITILLIGIFAFGYFENNDIGTYLTNLNAGVIMGIVLSFTMIYSEKIVYTDFTIKKLIFVSPVISIVFIMGLILAPLAMSTLLSRFEIQANLLAIMSTLYPTLIIIGFLKASGDSKKAHRLFQMWMNFQFVRFRYQILYAAIVLYHKMIAFTIKKFRPPSNNELYELIRTTEQIKHHKEEINQLISEIDCHYDFTTNCNIDFLIHMELMLLTEPVQDEARDTE
ncbi:uncharacterized protein LOC127291640 [Leptopilina boulardi]|uniref:uncharacterized protein LOC127277856 n=1 Tax=Leptopilina boulardi TaxID=63433 RepID=UPI0021F58CBB|nr:uncharacterized protein LOC127277856 [Leptopilina boulardi]XP_051157967.1 uncharacterized protein LOC127279579 [Leptopilina boulardi]XP_051161512.1 uncharacterized protein LOC127281704 [Leptopilina boulardi]XP_051176798.1 uncharacterized protein LOC127291640 [Leptopilina boulardi]